MITSLLFEQGQAQKAAEFYAATFPDSHVGKVSMSPLDGSVMSVEFTVCGQPFLGIHVGAGFAPSQAVSFMVLTEDQAETDRLWDAVIRNGGEELWCGWCKDRWGFAWQITPRVLLAATHGSDRPAAKRVMEAMMKMRKIDIAAIESAQAG